MADELIPDNIPDERGVRPITIEEEMQKSYMDYAMSVIVSRALPDVRDGLKPVHRRILYAMKEGGYDSGKPFRKSARIVGDVMGKYHPHGDQAIYDAMVRMVQSFSLRLPLISGQGNFGSVDGDPPAAMRYTEARLGKSAEVLLDDIDKQTVEFIANYDESSLEPEVLPARFPNILANGGSGIAVGMATNIPPHNLGELLDACMALLRKPDMTLSEIMHYVEAPDFPTGGIIMGRSGILKAFATGHGSVLIRPRTHTETVGKERQAIIVTEIPYQVNKSRLLERIAEAVRDKIIEGISDLRDESDRDGMRIVIELKRDAVVDIVLNQLYRHSSLQQSFGVNMLALRDGMPEMLSLPEMLRSFLRFRDETVIKRTRYLLHKARSRVHILVGLLVAIGTIDEIIETIKSASDVNKARDALMSKPYPASIAVEYIRLLGEESRLHDGDGYVLSAEQAKAILELRLQRLTGMEREKLEQESRQLSEDIKLYLSILGDSAVRRDVIISEMEDIRERFATPRRTSVEDQEYSANMEDFIKCEDMVLTVTFSGYTKRVPLVTYRTQKRGGKGRSGMSTKDDDFVWKVFVADTLTPILFFTSRGMVYEKKVFYIPEGSPTSRGKALVNLFPFEANERVTTVMPLPKDISELDNLYVLFATAQGNVRRNRLSDFTNIRSNGKIAMKLSEGDSLVSVRVCHDDQDVFLATSRGRAIRFPISRIDSDGNERSVRVFSGRDSSGVRGIRLSGDDRVVSMNLLDKGASSHDPEVSQEYLMAIKAERRLMDADYARGRSEDVRRDKKRRESLGSDLFKSMRDGEEFILSVSSSGSGQLCSAYSYSQKFRGGSGIRNMDIGSDENIVASYLVVPDDNELMLITDAGQIIRIPVAGVRQTARDSKGVRLFDIGEAQKIISCAQVTIDAEAEVDEDDSDGVDVVDSSLKLSTEGGDV